MTGFCKKSFEDIVSSYDGPVLVERLHHITLTDPENSVRASLEALKYLDRIDQFSPYLGHFITLLRSEAPEQDIVVDRYKDQNWALQKKNQVLKKLKNIGNDSWYHETNLSKNIEVANIYSFNRQYTEAQAALGNSTQSCELSQQSAQIALLQQNYSIVINQNKRAETFLSTALSNELYLKRLTDTEVQSYWTVKLLVIFKDFLRNSYKDVWNEMFSLINSPPIKTASGNEISVLSVLNNDKLGKFISKDEIVLAVVLSILLSRPTSELNDALKETEFLTLVGSNLENVQPLFHTLNNAKFIELFKHLDDLSHVAKTNYFFSRVWKDVRLKFRQKGYGLYLSLITRVTADHLSEKLGIEKSQLIREIITFIEEQRLEFVFHEHDEIFERVKHSRKSEFIDRLQIITEDIDAVEDLLREKLDTTRHQFAVPLNPPITTENIATNS